MDKDFDQWNEQKKILNTSSKKFFFNEGEIWWCSIGLNIGTESYGKGKNFRRPVLVLKKLSNDSFIGIPISSKKKYGSWFTEITIHGERRSVLLYQVRMFSINRFHSRLVTLDSHDFINVKEKLETLLELS